LNSQNNFKWRKKLHEKKKIACFGRDGSDGFITDYLVYAGERGYRFV